VPIRILTIFLLAASVFIGCGGCNGDDNNGPKPPGPPDHIVAINGLYYKADSLDQRPLEFAVADADGTYLPDEQILLNLLSGDGTLSDLSITTDSTGTASFDYEFTGTAGHAVIQLFVVDVDLIEVYIRRNTLIPGAGGQGQYVRFSDRYEDVVDWNGAGQVDVFANHWIIYVNYESSLGVVVMTYDLDLGGVIFDTSSVYGVIVNTVYAGKTPDGIGVGSPYDSVLAAYGPPDSVWLDTSPPPAIGIEYSGLDMVLYGNTTDTTIIEMHLGELVTRITGEHRILGKRYTKQLALD
jgi:hypothetical protein